MSKQQNPRNSRPARLDVPGHSSPQQAERHSDQPRKGNTKGLDWKWWVVFVVSVLSCCGTFLALTPLIFPSLKKPTTAPTASAFTPATEPPTVTPAATSTSPPTSQTSPLPNSEWIAFLANYTNVEEQITIARVVPGSGAQRAGIQPGDIITAVDGQPVRVNDDVACLIQDHSIGDEITLRLRRGESDIELQPRLGSRTNSEGREIPFLGILYGPSFTFDIPYLTTPDGEFLLKWNGRVGTWSPDARRVAFSEQGPESLDIFASNIDSSETVNLTEDTFDDYAPSWSPNGDWIVYLSVRNDAAYIYVTDSEGANSWQLTSHAVDLANVLTVSLSWSSTGRRLVFNDGKGALYLVDFSTGNTEVLFSSLLPIWYPAWSPDGQRIAFVGWLEPSTDEYSHHHALCLVNSDGTNAIQVTDERYDVGYLSWSPDSQKLVFDAIVEGHRRLYTAQLETEQLQPLISVGVLDAGLWFPSWSPKSLPSTVLGDSIVLVSAPNR